jgi:uncharacterized protein YbbC (DUF1343 family)
MQVRTGHEKLLDEQRELIRGRRVGLIVNPTSVGPDLIHLATRIAHSDDVRLAALFGPEHGILGTAQDMISVPESSDTLLGVPVFSLYGDTLESLRPDPDQFQGLDVLVFDIQDIGTRYYTYAYTLMLAMEVAAEAGVHVVVLDRPNPIGGAQVEGNVVHPGWDSFVGMHPLANRHGMTLGELAQLFRSERAIDVELTVVTMDGWSREMLFNETGLPWVMPSPNMPTPDTALVYPGMCLVEGTAMSEGRGTTRPFEIAGAPWLNGETLADALMREGLPGVRVRALGFEPTFQKHAGAFCGGVQLHVTDPRTYDSMRTGVAFIRHCHALGGADFDWRREVYEYVDDRLAIDLLFGDPLLRETLEAGATTEDLMNAMEPDRQEFLARRSEFLLYDRESR